MVLPIGFSKRTSEDCLRVNFEPPLSDQKRKIADLEGWILSIM